MGSEQRKCRDRQAVHKTYFGLTPAGGGWQRTNQRAAPAGERPVLKNCEREAVPCFR